jgi:alcohol dehydrogenase class IV
MDMETHHRLELFDPKTRPSAIIWDNDALLTAPASLYLSASASAFSGVATGVATSNPNPIAHGDRLQALRLMLDNIPKLDTDQDGGDVRLQLAAAAFLSNRASDVESSGGGGGFGIISALAHTVDTLYEDCSHGAAYSITTPPGLRFNIAQTVAGQARLAAALGADADDGGEESLAHAAAERVESFYRSVGMPLRLRDVGVPQSDLTRIAEDAQKDFYLHRNPRPVQGGADLIRLLEGMW